MTRLEVYQQILEPLVKQIYDIMAEHKIMGLMTFDVTHQDVEDQFAAEMEANGEADIEKHMVTTGILNGEWGQVDENLKTAVLIVTGQAKMIHHHMDVDAVSPEELEEAIGAMVKKAGVAG